MRDFVIAIIVLDPERLAKHAEENGKEASNPALIEDLKPIIKADLNNLA